MKDLETIYESMLSPALGNMQIRVIRQPEPLDALESEVGEYDASEECDSCPDMDKSDEEVLDEILDHVDELKEIAKDAMVKSYKEKIEHCAEKIAELVNTIQDDD